MTHLPRFEGFRNGIARAVMAADRVVWSGWNCGLDTCMLALREELPMGVADAEVDLRELRTSMDYGLERMDGKLVEGLKRVDAKLDSLEARLEGKLDRTHAKFESRFDTLAFALLIALLSAIVTLVTAVLGVLLSGSHMH